MDARDLRDRRRTAGLTQAELARRTGVPQPNISAYESGKRVPTDDVLRRLDEALRVKPSVVVARFRTEIDDTTRLHRARRPRVFGSIARGDDLPGSDLDLLVEFTDEATLLDEIALRQALECLLRIPVDVVAEDSLRGAVKERILAEAVPLR